MLYSAILALVAAQLRETTKLYTYLYLVYI